MTKLAILVVKFFLNLIYGFMKLLPRDDRIVFLSRQSNDISLDFFMLQEELKARNSQVKIFSVCCRLEGEKSGFGKLVQFTLATLKSMYYMVKAKVVILDAYWPAVSILKHKKGLKVIQIWHALGKIKQSGYQTLCKESGRGKEIAKLMNMHRGYDFIIAGGRAWNPYYCQSFDVEENKLRNFGLPRIDFLLESESENRKKFFETYRELEGKKIILYAPTFRKNMTANVNAQWETLVEELFKDEANPEVALIVKSHPNQKLTVTEKMKALGVYECEEFKAVDILAVADYLVTDYSAIAIEGAILSVPTYYFLYDYEEYIDKNGMNLDLMKELPKVSFRDASALVENLKSGGYDSETLKEYREKYLPEDLGESTEKIVDLILENM